MDDKAGMVSKYINIGAMAVRKLGYVFGPVC
jgi:hypothetical protein